MRRASLIALPSAQLLHHDPVALDFVQIKLDRCGCLGRRHVGGFNRAKDFALGGAGQLDCWPYQGSGRYGFDATILPAIARGFLAGKKAAAARLNELPGCSRELGG